MTFENGNFALTIFLFSTDCRFGLLAWVSFDGGFFFFFFKFDGISLLLKM